MEEKYYIVENGSRISEIEIIRNNGNLYTLKIIKTGTVLRLPRHRILSADEVRKKYPGSIPDEIKKGYRAPDLH